MIKPMYWMPQPLRLLFRAILENIVEFQPEMSKDIAEAGFMAWLIKKLKVKLCSVSLKKKAMQVDCIAYQWILGEGAFWRQQTLCKWGSVHPLAGAFIAHWQSLSKLRCWLFSVFNQNEPANRLLFGNMDAMDSMLQQLAYYKRHDPAVAEEVT